ncbi:MAG: AAA family ATPase [Bacteroidales bacterium]
MLVKEDIVRLFAAHFPFEPNAGQWCLMEAFSDFILRFREPVAFVLKGYAGTGKTSMVSALIKTLPLLKIQTVLLAPTGRAAKVLSNYSGLSAYTIHKQIYYSQRDENGILRVQLRKNVAKNTLFVVDEASMLGIESRLLVDLFSFVSSGFQCRLLLLGDSAQLPPVGSAYSPALDLDFLRSNFSFDFMEMELSEVLRQGLSSLVLKNATILRNRISSQKFSLPLFKLNSHKEKEDIESGSFVQNTDLKRINGENLEDLLQSSYSRLKREEVVFITRSNKRANLFNQQIRAQIFGMEGELAAGDLLMILKNNYYWVPKTSTVGFLANGDMIEVLKVKGRKDLYGFHFADIEARLLDYPEEPSIEVKIILETLHIDGPALPYTAGQALFSAVLEDYADLPTRSLRMAAAKENPYYNALQVKYGYALTCHKTQGGQWPCVFIDQGYFTDEMASIEYLRWLYTALTRCMSNCYLLGFSDQFFEQTNEAY